MRPAAEESGYQDYKFSSTVLVTSMYFSGTRNDPQSARTEELGVPRDDGK